MEIQGEYTKILTRRSRRRTIEGRVRYGLSGGVANLMRINLVKSQVNNGGNFKFHGIFSGTTHTYCDMIDRENLSLDYLGDFLIRIERKWQFTLFSFDSALVVRL